MARTRGVAARLAARDRACRAARARTDGPGRTGVLVPFVGDLGQAESGGARAAFDPAHRTGVARGAGHRRRRPVVRELQVVLFLPTGEQPVRRPQARCHGAARPAVADRGEYRGQRRGTAPDAAVQRAFAVPQPVARRAGSAHRERGSAPMRVGRRGLARELARRLARADGLDHRRRLRRFRNPDPRDARSRRRAGLQRLAGRRDRAAERAERRNANPHPHSRAHTRTGLP